MGAATRDADAAAEQRARAAAEAFAAMPTPRVRPGSTRRREPDTLTGSGAQRIAEKIRSFWSAAGFSTVVVEIVRTAGVGEKPPIYAIRSNLLAGLPPAHKPNGEARDGHR
jgi:hypothetical protein